VTRARHHDINFSGAPCRQPGRGRRQRGKRRAFKSTPVIPLILCLRHYKSVVNFAGSFFPNPGINAISLIAKLAQPRTTKQSERHGN
jgi:hypothetical protein